MLDNQNLKGKIALVTGASRGIGKAISLALAGAGATVLLSARTVEKLKEVKAEIEKGGGKAEVLPVDISKTSDIINLFRDIKDRFGRLDILINNAAIGIFGDMADLTSEDFDKTFEVNVKSIFTTSKQALKMMIPQKSGYIINISSIMGVKELEQSLAPKPDEPITPELAERYRRLFANQAGIEVLTDILIRLDFFSTLDTPGAVARHNYAMQLLAFVGILKSDPKKIIGALMSIAE